jgi:hypothetical protein
VADFFVDDEIARKGVVVGFAARREMSLPRGGENALRQAGEVVEQQADFCCQQIRVKRG